MHSLSTAHLISAVCAVVVAAIAAGTTSIVSQTTTISITADHTVVTVVVTTCYCCCHAAACYRQCAATITAPAAVFSAPTSTITITSTITKLLLPLPPAPTSTEAVFIFLIDKHIFVRCLKTIKADCDEHFEKIAMNIHACLPRYEPINQCCHRESCIHPLRRTNTIKCGMHALLPETSLHSTCTLIDKC